MGAEGEDLKCREGLKKGKRKDGAEAEGEATKTIDKKHRAPINRDSHNASKTREVFCNIYPH